MRRAFVQALYQVVLLCVLGATCHCCQTVVALEHLISSCACDHSARDGCATDNPLIVPDQLSMVLTQSTDTPTRWARTHEGASQGDLCRVAHDDRAVVAVHATDGMSPAGRSSQDRPRGDMFAQGTVPRLANSVTEPLTIVAFGDSTTAPRGSLVTYSELLRQKLPAMGQPVEVINAGVRGHTVYDARDRFASDVLAHHPDLVIIQFGINDSFIFPPSPSPRVPLREFSQILEGFVGVLKSRRIDVILMTPNSMRWADADLKKTLTGGVYDMQDPNGLNTFLRVYADAVRSIAQRQTVDLVDVFEALECYARKPGKSAHDLLLDGVHPNDLGHQMIAEMLIARIRDATSAKNRPFDSRVTCASNDGRDTLRTGVMARRCKCPCGARKGIRGTRSRLGKST